MRIVVQKFGGSSVATPALREQVANRIIEAIDEGYIPVVVLSAIGRDGDPYATDTLIKFARQTYEEIEPRELDLLMHCGEIISCVVMGQTLKKRGYETVTLTGSQASIITDCNYTNAHIVEINPEKILENLKDNKIVLVAGFQGGTRDGEITTLGRGGSDTTAAALGVALKAEMVDIFTDVEGIMTADPRIVQNARILDKITYNEICQLAHLGAKVIHPRSVEIAMQGNIPLRVRCTFSDKPGTMITNNGYQQIEYGASITSDKVITGVTYIPKVSQFKIDLGVMDGKSQMELKIFENLALEGVSIDLINVYPNAVIFTVNDDMTNKTRQVLERLNLSFTVENNCAKISVVGAGMRGLPGVMAKVVSALNEVGVEILQTADSHTTISCLVKQEEMEKAVMALHHQFGLDR